jgi:hypothetical protein
MDLTQIIYFLLGNLVTQIPILILLIVGIIFTFFKWSKHPKVAKLALCGFCIFLFTILLGLVFSFLRVQLPYLLERNYDLISYINIGIGFVENIVWTFGLALLFYAVWVDREKTNNL